MEQDTLTSPFLIVVGVALLVGMSLELGVRTVSSTDGVDLVAAANMVATLPFVGMLLGVGYVLRDHEAEDLEHARVLAWVLSGTALFLSFFLLIAVTSGDSLLTRIQVVRWGIAAGAGSGALVGFFEFRAIRRALDNQRVQARNRDLREEKARLDEFASIISHDLRNPLNVAEGYLDLISRDYEDERFERIERAHQRMHQIIEDTLILARTEHNVEDPEPVELEALATDCWATVETAEATLEIAGDATVMADPQHLRRMLENLFRNAVEHAGPDVTVRVTATPEGFMVEDDGPGIPPGEREDVFEAGYSTAEDGIGFGLRIVRHVIDAHGWEIELSEGDTGGVRFDITDVDVAE